MFTKEQVIKHVADAVENDARSGFPLKSAIESGAYKAFYNDVYHDYVRLAIAVKELRAEIDKLPSPLPSDLYMAACHSFDINCAIRHLDKILETAS
jgi:hypothetical protein